MESKCLLFCNPSQHNNLPGDFKQCFCCLCCLHLHIWMIYLVGSQWKENFAMLALHVTGNRMEAWDEKQMSFCFFSFLMATFLHLFFQPPIFPPNFVVIKENENSFFTVAWDCSSFEIKLLTLHDLRVITVGCLAFNLPSVTFLGQGLIHSGMLILYFRLILLTKQTFYFLFCRLGGIQSIWDWYGKVWHFYVSWFVWKQVFYGDSGEEVQWKSFAFLNGWVCDRRKLKTNFSSVE